MLTYFYDDFENSVFDLICFYVDSDDFNASDIDLNASYSDSDTDIPLEDKKLGEYLQKLEENNLFEMNLFQDRTQMLEKMDKETQAKIKERQQEIYEFDNNITQL